MSSESRPLGIPCEVYSRVVGYYRPVTCWNEGKRQEFSERNIYDVKLKEGLKDAEKN